MGSWNVWNFADGYVVYKLSIKVCTWFAMAHVVNKLPIKVCLWNVWNAAASVIILFITCQSKCVYTIECYNGTCLNKLSIKVCSWNVRNFVDGHVVYMLSIKSEYMECCNDTRCKQAVNESVFMECMECGS